MQSDKFVDIGLDLDFPLLGQPEGPELPFKLPIVTSLSQGRS